MRFVFEDLTGKVFSRWTVVSYAGKEMWGKSLWKCRCSCGKEKVLVKDVIVDGRSKSCGCLRREWNSTTKRTHGDSRKTRLYEIWASMLKRCRNANAKNWHNYGGRGIKVCDRWLSFASFKEDVIRDYRDDLTIDRIDNNGDYEPQNVRWATRKQQMRNVRYNRHIAFRGEIKTAAEWADVLGVPTNRFLDRIDKLGWTIDRAMTEPSKHLGRVRSTDGNKKLEEMA